MLQTSLNCVIKKSFEKHKNSKLQILINIIQHFSANPYHDHMDEYTMSSSYENTSNNNNSSSKYERSSYQSEANTDALQLYASNSSTSSLSSYSSPMLLSLDNPGSPEPSNSSSAESKPAKAKLNPREKKKTKESKKASHAKKSKPNKTSNNKESEEKKKEKKKDEKRKSQKRNKTPNSSDLSLSHSRTYDNENSSSTTPFNAKIRSRSLSPFEPSKLADISTFSNIETNANSARPSKKRQTSEHNKKDRASSASSASSSSNKRFKGAENIDAYHNGSNLLSLMTEIKKNNVTDKQKRKQSERAKAKSKKSASKSTHHHHNDEKVKKEAKKEANLAKATNESSDPESSKILIDEINDPAASAASSSILVLVDFDLSSASKQTSCQLCSRSPCGQEMDELCAILPIIQYKLTNENFDEYWHEFLIKYDLVNEYDFILKRLSLMARSSMYNFKENLCAMMGLDENEPSLDKKEIIIEDFRTKLELMDRIAAECLERLQQQKVYLNELREFFKYDVRDLSWQQEEGEVEVKEKEKEKEKGSLVPDQIRKKIYNLQFDLIEYARMIKQYQSEDLVKAFSFDCLVDVLDRFIQMYYYIYDISN